MRLDISARPGPVVRSHDQCEIFEKRGIDHTTTTATMVVTGGGRRTEDAVGDGRLAHVKRHVAERQQPRHTCAKVGERRLLFWAMVGEFTGVGQLRFGEVEQRERRQLAHFGRKLHMC